MLPPQLGVATLAVRDMRFAGKSVPQTIEAVAKIADVGAEAVPLAAYRLLARAAEKSDEVGLR